MSEQLDIRRIVDATARAVLARQITVEQATARIMATFFGEPGAAPGSMTPREATATARQRQNTAMMARYENLVTAGRKRAAASVVAKEFARDPLDPIEVETLAQHLRRLARRRKTSTARLPDHSSRKVAS